MSKFILIVIPSPEGRPFAEGEFVDLVEGALADTPDGHKLAVERLTEHATDDTYMMWFEAPSLRVARELCRRVGCEDVGKTVGLYRMEHNGSLRPIAMPTALCDEVEEAGRESFPASDPPSFTASTGFTHHG